MPKKTTKPVKAGKKKKASKKSVVVKKEVGRPSKFTKDLATKICNRLSEGESLRKIVKDKDMPSSSTICRWLLDETKKGFWEQYEKARNIQAELMFEELIEIADDASNDYMLTESDNNVGWRLNGESVGRSRLRVDTRKWFLSKVLPKKFGDKLDMSSGGDRIQVITINYADSVDAEGDPPLQVQAEEVPTTAIEGN